MQSQMLALRLLSLQAQPVICAHKFVDISWRECSTGFADDKFSKWIEYSSDIVPTIKN